MLGVDGHRRNNMMTRICLDAAMPVFGPEGLVFPRVARPPPWPPPSLSLIYTQQPPLGYLGFELYLRLGLGHMRIGYVLIILP